ncbi:MAG TPA: hypothetical protein DHW82_03550 [Spirochaetia bacterium]|nr:MAG: hypothetical protein A2Y41_06360 [Spirochaetes bacterium GWB1_36_13]HCL56068.1 hypothetical protein [Spirochaetia bacterium]
MKSSVFLWMILFFLTIGGYTQEDESSFSAGGYIRTLFFGTKPNAPGTVHELFLSSANRLAFETQFLSSSWEFHLNADFDFIFSNSMNETDFRLIWGKKQRNQPIPSLYYNINQDGLFQINLKRAFVKYQGESLIAVIGRQTVSWGEGRLLNPLNLITPVSSFALDIEDVSGADCFYFQWYWNEFDSVQFVALPYARENKSVFQSMNAEDVNLFIRTKITADTTDLVFLAGRQFHSLVFGAEANMGIGDASLRFSYLGRREEEKVFDHMTAHQIAAGGSYAFFGGKLRSSLEFFFNSAPWQKNEIYLQALENETLISSGFAGSLLEDASFFLSSGKIITRNPFLMEASFGYQISELLDSEFFLLFDPKGKSLYLSPVLTYNLSDEAVWTLGGGFYLNQKNSDSEFQGANAFFYTYLKWYF